MSLLSKRVELIYGFVYVWNTISGTGHVILHTYSVAFWLLCDADVTVYRDKSGLSELMGSQDSSSTLASQPDSDHEDGESTPRHR